MREGDSPDAGRTPTDPSLEFDLLEMAQVRLAQVCDDVGPAAGVARVVED